MKGKLSCLPQINTRLTPAFSHPSPLAERGKRGEANRAGNNIQDIQKQ
jgi:hypothetical protein